MITLADRKIRTTILQLRARQEFGLRWQPAEAKRSEDWSAAATPLSALQDDSKSGVAPALRDSPAAVQNRWLQRKRRCVPSCQFVVALVIFAP
jgi:hypothetical protein